MSPRLLLRRLLRPFRADPVARLRRLGVRIGRDFSMQPGVVIDESHAWLIAIGDSVTLAPHVFVLAHDASSKRALGYTRVGKVHIGDRVFVGARSIVMPGVHIGNDVIVGAGSVVTRDVPDGVVVTGNPARPIGTTAVYLDKRRQQMGAGPTFDATCTVAGGISDELKRRMNDEITQRFGFVE